MDFIILWSETFVNTSYQEKIPLQKSSSQNNYNMKYSQFTVLVYTMENLKHS